MSARSASLFSRATLPGNLERVARESGLKARAASTVAGGGGDAVERALIEAAQRDPSRFADLYQANFERVYAYVARRVRDRDEAQDLTADVFHLALKGIARFEWRGVPFVAWLFRIASNEIADQARSVAKRRTHDSFLQENDAGGEIAVSIDDAERRARLFKLVERLPRDQSQVIVMRFAEDKSIREIATALGRTEGSVKQLQFRGLQNLRVRLGDANG